MKFFFSCLILLFSVAFSYSQTNLTGKVSDSNSGEELINATIQLFKEGVFVQGAVTDFNGNYKINVDPGVYEVFCTYLGFVDQRIEGVIIKAGQSNKLDIVIGEKPFQIFCGGIIDYDVPLILQEPKKYERIQTHREIRKAPVKSIRELSALSAGVSFQ